jgi:hypothetical protein
VSVESLRVAALEALDHARVEVELDPDWLADELTRLSEKPKAVEIADQIRKPEPSGAS